MLGRSKSYNEQLKEEMERKGYEECNHTETVHRPVESSSVSCKPKVNNFKRGRTCLMIGATLIFISFFSVSLICIFEDDVSYAAFLPLITLFPLGILFNITGLLFMQKSARDRKGEKKE